MEQELKDKLRKLLENAAEKIPREQFDQEPLYTSAFFGKLNKEKIEISNGQYIELEFAPSNDRGPSSPESHTGIDIGMVFEWIDDDNELFRKAVLVQAKNHLQKKQSDNDLEMQCKKMREITSHYVVMDCPYDKTIPELYFSQNKPPYWDINKHYNLYDYLVDYVFVCKQGDIKNDVIQGALDAKRTIFIKTNAPKPVPTPPKPKKKRKRYPNGLI